MSSESEQSKKDYLQEVTPADLVKFGMIPEFLGRVPVTVCLNELTEEALMNILTQPKNAITKQYETMFSLDGIEIKFEESAVRAVAKKALQLKTGARGLRTILEEKMLRVMFTAPSDKTIKSVIINEDFINKNAEPVYIRGEIQEAI